MVIKIFQEPYLQQNITSFKESNPLFAFGRCKKHIRNNHWNKVGFTILTKPFTITAKQMSMYLARSKKIMSSKHATMKAKDPFSFHTPMPHLLLRFI